MKLLLDTHAVFWWLIEESQLSRKAHAALSTKGNEVYVSFASAWEMAIKVGTGNWPEASGLIENCESEVAATSFRLLPITVAHARTARLMLSPHRDPFDRLLAAQAQIEGLTLVTADPKVRMLGAPCLW